jgi:hypothetical protein
LFANSSSTPTLDVENTESVGIPHPDQVGSEARSQSRGFSLHRADTFSESVDLTAEPTTTEAVNTAVSPIDPEFGNVDLDGHAGQAGGVGSQLGGDLDNKSSIGSQSPGLNAQPSMVEATHIPALPTPLPHLDTGDMYMVDGGQVGRVRNRPNEDDRSDTEDIRSRLVERGTEPLTVERVHSVAPTPPSPDTNAGYNLLLDKPRPNTMTEYLRFVQFSNSILNDLTPFYTATATSSL